MMSRRLLLALSVVVLWPALLRAQAPSRSTGAPTAEAGADRAMYEDIEIMRRILDRKLHPLYPQYLQYPFGGMMGMPPMGMQSGMMGMQGGMVGMQGGMTGMQGFSMMGNVNPVLVTCPTLEGVYLKGQGVVYTATLSSLQPAAKAETETPKPISEWESVRRQLHNTKEEPKKPQTSKPAALSDVLLKVLAENGPHFSWLGANESLIIVITVHEKGQSAAAPKSGGGSAKTESKPAAGGKEDSLNALKVRDLELLADLHLKQGRYEEAAGALKRAIVLRPAAKQAAELHHKLAQAYLALGKEEDARGTLERAIALRKGAADAKEKPAADTKPAAVTLPRKLIISAPKKLLDQVGEKKITFEEFRRRASLETLTFDTQR